MIIGMDMDGCLVDFVGSALPRIQQLWGVDIQYEDIVEPKIEVSINKGLAFPVSGEALCTSLFQPGFFASMLPRYGAIESLRRLTQQGHEIVIVTRAHLEAGHVVREKTQWLTQHLQGIDYKTIVIGQGGTKHLVNVDILVDDEPGNLEHPTAISVCAVHPWNLHYLWEIDTRKQPVHVLHSMGFLSEMVHLIKESTDPKEVFDEAELKMEQHQSKGETQ